jgi:hypothetical protein
VLGGTGAEDEWRLDQHQAADPLGIQGGEDRGQGAAQRMPGQHDVGLAGGLLDRVQAGTQEPVGVVGQAEVPLDGPWEGPSSQPSTNVGPLARARGVVSSSTTAMIEIGLTATPIASGRDWPIAAPIIRLSASTVTVSPSGRPPVLMRHRTVPSDRLSNGQLVPSSAAVALTTGRPRSRLLRRLSCGNAKFHHRI